MEESDLFPRELTERRQWICWRLERNPKTDKPNKTPYDPHTGYRASSINSATWGTLAEAESAIKKYGYTGLGFVFTKDDDLVGVDIDHCRDKVTGVLNETAAAILAKARTYTEISPSGTGLHLFFHGQIPEGGNKNSGTGVEMYAHSRYFTMTGNRANGAPLEVLMDDSALRWIHETYIKPPKQGKPVPGRKAPEKRKKRAQRAKAAPLSDEAVLERALATDKEELFAKLWSGRWQTLYASQSEADMALCCKLAFWTGKDREQIDRLFRQSKLFRPKWDERHLANGATYGEETIGKAVDLVEESYNPTSSEPVFELDGRYYRAKGDSVTPLTNFVLNPVEMVESDEETQLTADLVTVRGETFRHSFLTTDFTNLQRFKNAHNRAKLHGIGWRSGAVQGVSLRAGLGTQDRRQGVGHVFLCGSLGVRQRSACDRRQWPCSGGCSSIRATGRSVHARHCAAHGGAAHGARFAAAWLQRAGQDRRRSGVVRGVLSQRASPA